MRPRLLHRCEANEISVQRRSRGGGSARIRSPGASAASSGAPSVPAATSREDSGMPGLATAWPRQQAKTAGFEGVVSLDECGISAAARSCACACPEPSPFDAWCACSPPACACAGAACTSQGPANAGRLAANANDPACAATASATTSLRTRTRDRIASMNPKTPAETRYGLAICGEETAEIRPRGCCPVRDAWPARIPAIAAGTAPACPPPARSCRRAPPSSPRRRG